MDNYKEKYEQALYYVKDLVVHNVVSQENASKYFSELRESEDEKIRKRLIEWVKEFRKLNPNNADHNAECSESLAWLEKQKPIEWSKEDREMIDDTIKAFQLAYPYALENENPRRKNIDWLKSIKDRVQPQSKQEWNGEDEKNLAKLASILEIGGNFNLSSWLKSLKPQRQYGYNPYKETVECIAEMCEKYATIGSDLPDFLCNVRVKCKEAKEYDSMFSEPHWKPSKQQMEALGFAKSDYVMGDVKTYLTSLYNDLKKL